ncbi:hypothetical protein ABCR94_29340 [Streptomyces sp. 21So2-11]|uniref:hypothetical protein n=1 Tax=Streptomyces sp. 21So2-11 TaxID=3144408 RepID=UPI0032191F4A
MNTMTCIRPWVLIAFTGEPVADRRTIGGAAPGALDTASAAPSFLRASEEARLVREQR